MSRLRCALLAALICVSVTAHAETLSPAKRADIVRLLDMTGALDAGRHMSAALMPQLAKIIRQTRPDVSQRTLDAVAIEVNAVFAENLGGLRDAVVPLYHKHFTAAEIRELIDFYSTPLGRKSLAVMPELMTDSMRVGQQWGESLGPKIEQRVKERLRTNGN